MPPIIYIPIGIHGYIRFPVEAEPPVTLVKWNKDGRPLRIEKVSSLGRVAGKGVAAVPAWRVLALDRMDGAALPYQQLCSELIQVPADILSVSQPSQMTF